MLGLHCWVGAFSSCRERGLLFTAVLWLLAAERRVKSHGLQWSHTQAQYLGHMGFIALQHVGSSHMRDRNLQCVFELAGEFLITGPPGKLSTIYSHIKPLCDSVSSSDHEKWSYKKKNNRIPRDDLGAAHWGLSHTWDPRLCWVSWTNQPWWVQGWYFVTATRGPLLPTLGAWGGFSIFPPCWSVPTVAG